MTQDKTHREAMLENNKKKWDNKSFLISIPSFYTYIFFNISTNMAKTIFAIKSHLVEIVEVIRKS